MRGGGVGGAPTHLPRVGARAATETRASFETYHRCAEASQCLAIAEHARSNQV